MLREGAGEEILTAIREAPRALVFVSVPWSSPERNARQVFRAAAVRLEEEASELGIAFFRLEADEDKASGEWLSSLGLSRFVYAGAGSLLWLESGHVRSSEITANSLGVDGVVARSMSLWRNGSEP
jgi:hypothetical protein